MCVHHLLTPIESFYSCCVSFGTMTFPPHLLSQSFPVLYGSENVPLSTVFTLIQPRNSLHL